MSYSLKFFTYERSFIQPLKTSHGIWKVRKGIIIKLTDRFQNVGWGEIAPLPWFGSEMLEEALLFCQSLNCQITSTQIRDIPDSLPACQFGFEAALITLNNTNIKSPINQSFCYLLPTGKTALSQFQLGYQQGCKTFKWKIGVSSLDREIKIFKQLITLLPNDTNLRLDANGGLNFQEAETWLKITDQLEMIEFIEQPLPPNKLDKMIDLNINYKTALALDESVANLRQLKDCYQQGWRGIFVMKPAIMGFPSDLRQLCKTYSMDLVFSSVFETSIGRNFVLNLAAELMTSDRAVGFGVKDWFNDDKNAEIESLCQNF
ncbi:MAG: o-succinylbenzoate synthase [Cyanobacteria bacterium P01_G01_bin.49]